MASHSLLVLWIHKFLVICRRWTSGSSTRLLQLLHWLTRWFRSCRSVDGASSDSLQGVSDDKSGRLDNRLRFEYEAISSSTNERAVVLSCSAMPVAPPPVHTHERIGFIDPSNISSPTLVDELSSLSDVIYKGERKYSTGSYSIGEASIQIHEVLDENPEHMAETHLIFQPTLPSQRPRYDRGVVIQDNTGPWIFEPLETLTVSEMQDYTPWLYHVHPEGQPYYISKHGSHRFSYLTEADVRDLNVRKELERFVDAIEKKAHTFELSSQIPTNVEVVLEIDAGREWAYYMVDLNRRCVFWLDRHDLSCAHLGAFGVESKHQYQHLLAFEFWSHIEYFPISHRQPLEGITDEVLETLNYFNIDSITSFDSTAPYGQAELQSLINSMKDFKASADASSSSCAVFGFARIMSIIANERFLNFYGFHGARLCTAQSVRSKGPNQRSRSMLMRCLSPVLFFAPDNYLWRFERLYVDGILRERSWQPFHEKLHSDLSGILLLSMVLLVANVGLLAVPNVLSYKGSVLWSSPAAATSQVSAIACLAGIIIGLQLKLQEIRTNAAGISRTFSHTIDYLTRGKHEQLNLETLAIHFSIPQALLIWGVVTFSASIAITCFNDVQGTPNLVSRTLYAVFWLFIVTLVLWSVLTGWELTTYSHWSDLLIPKWWLRLRGGRNGLQSGRKKAESITEIDELSLAEKASMY